MNAINYKDFLEEMTPRQLRALARQAELAADKKSAPALTILASDERLAPLQELVAKLNKELGLTTPQTLLLLFKRMRSGLRVVSLSDYRLIQKMLEESAQAKAVLPATPKAPKPATKRVAKKAAPKKKAT